MPISISSNVHSTWVEAGQMRKELQQYVFYKETPVRNYDTEGIIAHFYNIAFQKPIAFEHHPLGSMEKYKNV